MEGLLEVGKMGFICVLLPSAVCPLCRIQQMPHCLAARGGPHVEHHTSRAAKDVILEKIFHFFKGHQGSNMDKSNILSDFFVLIL